MGIEGLDRRAPQRQQGNAKIYTAGAIDEHGDADDARTGGADGVERVIDRAAGRQDVVDDQDAVRWIERLPATKRPTGAPVLTFGENGACPQLPADLVREDHATRGRTDDDVDRLADQLDDPGTQPLGEPGMFEDAELLQVSGRMPAGREDEVPLEEGAGLAKDPFDLVRRHRVN